jgi:hypothetical protein
MNATQATQYHVNATQTAAAALASQRHSSGSVFTTTQCSQQQQQLTRDVLTATCFDNHSAQYLSEMKQTIALMPAANVNTFAQVSRFVMQSLHERCEYCMMIIRFPEILYVAVFCTVQ